MPDATYVFIGAVVLFALVFDFINGFHDTANAIATSILTRALSIRNAIFLSAALNFAGAMIWTGVAETIGKGIVEPALVSGKAGQTLVLAALVGAITWNLITWRLGLPSSSSHALIGGVIGAAVAARGIGVLNAPGLTKIFAFLIMSPIVGFIAGAFLMVLVMNIFAQQAPSRLNKYFKVLQIVSASFMALTHGSNDAQKSMGIITMALVVGGLLPAVTVPLWVKISCATAMAFGTAAGGWRIIKTIGKKVIGLQPVHGFASETAAALVVLGATLWHAPVSTTHVVSSAIMGVGSAKRLTDVRWGIVGQIVLAWLMTLPVSTALGAVAYAILHLILR
ncbi:MAG TPA: inorganic phosphate transporter [Armatimonadota bacterium]|nr:inorganic phosphate transporter [Armatimonadota bacterium]